MRHARVLLFAAAGGYLIFGSPVSDFTNWIWPDKPAPWEKVDAFYYPDRTNLIVYRSKKDIGDVFACRQWAREAAYADKDFDNTASDYECGIGLLERSPDFDLNVYRVTTR